MNLKYKLNDKPSILPLLMYGIQWWIVSIPCVVIIGAVISKAHFTDIADQTFYVQKLFAIMGLASIIQVLWGHKLPLIIGPASVLLISILSSISEATSAIYTSIIIGGIVIMVLSYSGLLQKLQKIFTARIVTVILILIALSLTPVILKLVISTGNTLFNLAFALMFTFSLVILNNILKGIWKSTTILWGIILGSAVYFIYYGLPQIHGQYTNLNTENLFIPSFEINIGVLLSFLFSFIALIVNELGSIESITQLLKADKPEKRITNGIGILGASNILSGLFGVIGPVDYSMSAGVISSTGCASRYTIIPASIGLIICALFPNVIELLLNIPSLVMGALMIYLMSSQLATGLQMIITDKAIITFNDAIVMGLPIMIAILITFLPSEALAQVPSIIRPIVGNGFVMGVFCVLILEHCIFKQKSVS